MALNDTLQVYARAVDSDGNPLQNAQFFLDGTPVATSSTSGVHGEGAETQGIHVRADSGTASLIQANVTLSKIEQLLTVLGTNAQGVSVVSNSSTLYGKTNAGTPPVAVISNLINGANILAGSANQVVKVSADSGSQSIDKVELIVDSQSVGTVSTAPYNFTLPPLTNGPHVMSAIATDVNRLSKVSAPVVVTAGQTAPQHPAFFASEGALGSGVYFLTFPGGSPFGYYSYLSDPAYIYHFDLGFEYVFDAADGKSGVYLYDFASNSFFYTSPSFPFPYLYDFSLNAVLYYYPDANNAGIYTKNPRFFFNFGTGQIIMK